MTLIPKPGTVDAVARSDAANAVSKVSRLGVDPRDYGAAFDGVTDDSAALQSALDYAVANSLPLRIADGTLLLIQDVSNQSESDLVIIGSNATLKTVQTTGLNISAPTNELTLTAAVAHGDELIIVSDASNISVGDVIRLYSSLQANDSWGYNTRSVNTVRSVDGNTVNFNEPVNFSYGLADAGLSVTHSKGRVVDISGIRFDSDAGGSRGMTLSFCKNSRITNISGYGPDKAEQIDGFYFANCVNLSVNGLVIDRWRYGAVIACGRDVRFSNVRADNGRHAVVPSHYADGVLVKTLRGENNDGIMDSHPAFNVVYDDVVTSSDLDGSSLRAAGYSVLNSKLRSLGNVNDIAHGKFFWSQAPYDYRSLLASSYESRFENVEIVTQDGRKPTFSNASKLTLRNLSSRKSGGALNSIDVNSTVLVSEFESVSYEAATSSENSGQKREPLFSGSLSSGFLTSMINTAFDCLNGFNWQNETVGDGSVNIDPSGWIGLDSGVAGGSSAKRLLNYSLSNPWLTFNSGTSRQIRFQVPGGIVASIGLGNNTANGVSKVTYGRIGDSRIEIQLRGTRLWGLVDNNGVSQEGDLGIDIAAWSSGVYSRPHLIAVSWDGAGDFRFYRGDDILATIVNGPSSGEDFGTMIIEANESDGQAHSININRLLLGFDHTA